VRRDKGKGTVRPRTGHEDREVQWSYGSTLSLTSATGGVDGQRQPTSPQGKTGFPLYRSLAEPQGQSGLVRKISPPPGFDPRTIQPVASRYTD
jgi:hypothetical protein